LLKQNNERTIEINAQTKNSISQPTYICVTGTLMLMLMTMMMTAGCVEKLGVRLLLLLLVLTLSILRVH